MAKISFKLPDDMMNRMSMLGDRYDSIVRKVLEEGAKPLFEEAKSNLATSIGSDTKQPSRATGDLLKSLRTTRPFMDKDGNWGIKVGCEGTDRKGVSNAMKASVLEYGKSDQPARPWLKPSGSKAKRSCIEIMKKALEAEVEKL